MLRRHTFRVHKLFPAHYRFEAPSNMWEAAEEAALPYLVERDQNWSEGCIARLQSWWLWRHRSWYCLALLRELLEVFLTKLVGRLPCYFWNFWLSAVRTTSKTTTLALDGNTFVNFHSNLSCSQEKHALAFVCRYASCPQPVRCEARNVGSWCQALPRREVGDCRERSF